MLHAGRHDLAAKLIERALAHRYDAELVAIWPELGGVPVHARLKRAEGWLQQWGEEPALLVTLGRICAEVAAA